MPGVDFDEIRTRFTIEGVLQKLGWEGTRRRGAQVRGPCPVCNSGGHAFSVNLALNRYFCHHCKSRGNQLELWMAVMSLPVYEAAIDLCKTFNRPVPTVLKRR